MLLLNPEHLQSADKKVTIKHVMNTTNIEELTKLLRFVSLIRENFRDYNIHKKYQNIIV